MLTYSHSELVAECVNLSSAVAVYNTELSLIHSLVMSRPLPDPDLH